MSTEEYGFAIDVPVRNDWSNVALLVTSVQNCFNAMFANVEGSRTVAMVTGELLENAIKFSENRGEVTVRVQRAATGGLVELQVVDCGVGIPAEDLPRLAAVAIEKVLFVSQEALGPFAAGPKWCIEGKVAQ